MSDVTCGECGEEMDQSDACKHECQGEASLQYQRGFRAGWRAAFAPMTDPDAPGTVEAALAAVHRSDSAKGESYIHDDGTVQTEAEFAAAHGLVPRSETAKGKP